MVHGQAALTIFSSILGNTNFAMQVSNKESLHPYFYAKNWLSLTGSSSCELNCRSIASIMTDFTGPMH